MTNYSKRTAPIVRSEGAGYNSNDDWMSEFARHLEKNSVQSKSQTSSIYDQLYSVIRGNKPKYPSVDAAVEDMRNRTGLVAYHNQLKAEEEKAQSKTAQQKEIDVELFHQTPQIQSTVDNYIRDTRGNLAVPEIVDKIKSIHQKDVSDNTVWANPSFLMYVHNKNMEEKKKHHSEENFNDLGKVDFHDSQRDPSNDDALHILNPAQYK
jgi:tetrahydromethanopterin S-methyltransferase subunit F